MVMRKVLVFIPARMGSKRFPGKCMHKIKGFPLVGWTYVQARTSGYTTIVITPDKEINDDLFYHREIPCILTSNHPRNGSERCAEVMGNEIFDTMGDEDIVIDVQGDMAKFNTSCLRDIVYLLSGGQVEFATAFAKLPNGAVSNPNRVKCAIRFDPIRSVILVDRFSRQRIPNRENYLHIGIYGYTKRALEWYCKHPPSKNELTMRLEQMRIVDNNQDIGGVISEVPMTIDCPEDVCFAEKEMQNIECFL